MAIAINGSTNVITGVSVGGLPNGIVDADMLATNAVQSSKIQNGTIAGEDLSTAVRGGVALAWVNFDGTTNTGGQCTVRQHLNVTSVTDNGTGDYTISFTNAFSDTDYVMVGSSGGANSTSNGAVYQYEQASAKTPSACRILLISTSGGVVDTPHIAVAFFGD